MPRSSLVLAYVDSHGAHAATSAPGWAIAVGIGGTFLFLLGWFGLVVLTLRHPPGFGDDENDGSGPGGGDPGWRRPGGPRRPGGDPDWWPEFERQFAAHVELVAGREASAAGRRIHATGRLCRRGRMSCEVWVPRRVMVTGDPRP